eukprot:TRINITY_DN10272_c0_g5_i2.p2 TRINITY_DN10272_c0_g5~~TRINITY_DN10272_c0_g5_i2.p2  ORF type:complete len:333 (-),score=38.54 TRINITY_DN10272_c0_g5_i2:321-1319(-)
MNTSEDTLGPDHPKYKKIKDIYQGTAGCIQLCQNKETQEFVIIKFIVRGRATVTEQLINAVLLHRTLIHPNIIGFIEVFLLENYLAIVTEHAGGGEMVDYAVKKKGLKEDEARRYFQQLIMAVDYCHSMGVFNREIKFENVLLDGAPMPMLKLCDSKNEFAQCSPKSKDKVPRHIAPEIIQTNKYDSTCADIWACGVLLYVLLIGAFPFERPEDAQVKNSFQLMVQRVVSGDYRIPRYPRLSAQCVDLLQKLLVVDPSLRITVQQIYQHPWFIKNLPKEAENSNKVQPLPHRQAQSEAQIKQILNQARSKEMERYISEEYISEIDSKEFDEI